MKKMPPREKIHEAISVLADGRIEIDGTHASITSSDYSKLYTVTWNTGKSCFTSNDSATYWQGYPGYPVLAVLMQMNVLPVASDLGVYFKNINWHALNTKYKRNYAAAADEVLHTLDEFEKKRIESAIDGLYATIEQLNIAVKRGREPVIKLDAGQGAGSN